MNNDTEILHAVAGDPAKVYRKGVELTMQVFSVPILQKADIVILDAYGNDLDFWQANKGVNP